MDSDGFRTWLLIKEYTPDSINSRVSGARAIERNLTGLGISHDDLDTAFEEDQLLSVRRALMELKKDAAEGGDRFRLLMLNSERAPSRLSNFIAYLKNYRQFKMDDLNREESADADRIRNYVLQTYINPGRLRGDTYVQVPAREVHDALQLQNAFPNVCQAIAGNLMQKLAGVPAPERQGPEKSSTTIYTFSLKIDGFSHDVVIAELKNRFGEPINIAQKIISFETKTGRQIAIDRERPAAQLWVEADAEIPFDFVKKYYEPNENRHSGLPPRLKNNPANKAEPRAVAVLQVSSMDMLHKMLNWYSETETKFNRKALEDYKSAFLKYYPDFEALGFAAQTGGYYSQERRYKDQMIEAMRVAVAEAHSQNDVLFGEKLLDILTGQGGTPGDLLGWRINTRVKELRRQFPDVLEVAAAKLAKNPSESGRIEAFVNETWQTLSVGQSSKPYNESRSISSMLAALINPADAYGINSSPVMQFTRALCGRNRLGSNPLTKAEYADVLSLMKSVFIIMKDVWGWAPRDMWDVQGFVWIATRAMLKVNGNSNIAEDEDVRSMSVPVKPTNLILYGPPGTGKTYRTAQEAVRLCNGFAPSDRQELMAEYAKLTAAGRIDFVTFHQSYSYEEFVEGLRPVQGDGGTAGFHLEPVLGRFRLIAKRAGTSTSAGGEGIKIGDRQIFKISLGEAANPEHDALFEAALTDGYIFLGYDDLDWSDPAFVDRDAIKNKIASHGTYEVGETLTALNGRVQCPNLFRNSIKQGDLVIVSKGNSLFRAIGVVTGDYAYCGGEFAHRRAVEWLWSDPTGVPVEEIYDRSFSMRSLYSLANSNINMPALERYLASQLKAEKARPQDFVLIIDEINRANISKVFGELITLIEPDKRLGNVNELKVSLPYSRDVFGVPSNLHIIGTMNTADRSIALLDTALRRRFSFEELMPEPELLLEENQMTGVNLVKFLTVINQRIEYLFDREHQIGHAYFKGCSSLTEVDEVIRFKVIPLLAEYFYEDWSKIAKILGDTKQAAYFFDFSELKAPAGLEEDGAEPRYRWSVKAQFSAERYAQFQ